MGTWQIICSAQDTILSTESITPLYHEHAPKALVSSGAIHLLPFERMPPAEISTITASKTASPKSTTTLPPLYKVGIFYHFDVCVCMHWVHTSPTPLFCVHLLFYITFLKFIYPKFPTSPGILNARCRD